ncbi:putative Mucin-5AC-like 8 [Homarus americanus]|uniref:Putative Mucin-5AC-like 8 n=1 Tax=Homarus americanus TaxID=6706 RepID=A0A8J5J8X1_HOMAM|nr:putative Mucin-5AC-like 8 [Homarus americanus]
MGRFLWWCCHGTSPLVVMSWDVSSENKIISRFGVEVSGMMGGSVGGVWATWAAVAVSLLMPTASQVLIDLNAAAEAEESRALERRTSLADTVNTFLEETPKSGQQGVPVGEELGALLPPLPIGSHDAPVVMTHYTLPQGPPGKRQNIPVVMTRYTHRGHGDTPVVMTQFSFPQGVPGVDFITPREMDRNSHGGSVDDKHTDASLPQETQHVGNLTLVSHTSTSAGDHDGVPASTGVATDEVRPPSALEMLVKMATQGHKGGTPQGDNPPHQEDDEYATTLSDDDDYFWDYYGDLDGTTDSVFEAVSEEPSVSQERRLISPSPAQYVGLGPEVKGYQVSSSTHKYSQHTPAPPHSQPQLYSPETHFLAQQLEENLYRLTQNPQAHLIVQQLLRQEPEMQKLTEYILNKPEHAELLQTIQQQQQNYVPQGAGHNYSPQVAGQNYPPQGAGQNYTPQSPGQIYVPQSPGQNYSPQGAGQNYAPQGPEQNYAPQGPGQNYAPQGPGQNYVPLRQQHQSRPQLELAFPPPPPSNVDINKVETFNIVITKNLTGGQSEPSVQILSDAKVDSMLLNTTINSVNNIKALKDVVDSAVNHAIASNPVAIQETLAQVVEGPEQEPTVNVVNTTIPNLTELEDTINNLLGPNVVYEQNPQASMAVGHIPRSNGSVVSRLLNGTIGVENLNINSTSKTNVVNIFIINIIGGVRGVDDVVDDDEYNDDDVRPPALPPLTIPGQVMNFGTTVPLSSLGPLPPPPLPRPKPASTVTSQDSEEDSGSPAGLLPPVPPPQNKLLLKPPHVVTPSASLPPGYPGYEPVVTSSVAPSLPVPAPHIVSASSTQVPQGGQSTAHSANPDGIILNDNKVLNLLPEFIKATTIPPIVPLYNISAHSLLGKKPSVLGLLPSKVFEIIKPHLELSDNSTQGGIVRKVAVGNLTNYYYPSFQPVLRVGGTVTKSSTVTPPHAQYQFPSYNPGIPPPDPVPSNPFPFRAAAPPRYTQADYFTSKGSSGFYSAGVRNFSPPPAIGSARSPNPQASAIPYQNPLKQYNIVSERQPSNHKGVNLFKFTRNNSVSESEESGAQKVAGLRTEQLEEKKKSPQVSIKEESVSKPKTNTKSNTKDKKKSQSLKEMATDAVTSAGNSMDSFMKAVAIGALPSGIAFASAFWPYWAPFVLGRRRRRDLSEFDEAASRARISQDWLSILTGMKYKGAGTEFPEAWDKKNNPGKKQTTFPTRGQTTNTAGVTVITPEKTVSLTTKESSNSNITTRKSTTTEEATLRDSITVPPSVVEVTDNTNTTTINESKKVTPKSSEATKTTTVTKTSDKPEETELTTGDTTSSTDIKTEDIIRTTEKVTTVKRSTPANPTISTTTETNLNQSIAQMMSSLTSGDAEPVVLPFNVEVMSSGTTTEVNRQESPADVALVSNFLYSALNGWKNGQNSLTSEKDGLKEEFPLTVSDFVELQLSTGPPRRRVNTTDSPIIIINSASSTNNRFTSTPPPPPPLSQTIIPQTTNTPLRTTTNTPMRTTTRRPTTLLSRFPVKVPDNQATNNEDEKYPDMFYSTINLLIQPTTTTPLPTTTPTTTTTTTTTTIPSTIRTTTIPPRRTIRTTTTPRRTIRTTTPPRRTIRTTTPPRTTRTTTPPRTTRTTTPPRTTRTTTTPRTTRTTTTPRTTRTTTPPRTTRTTYPKNNQNNNYPKNNQNNNSPKKNNQNNNYSKNNQNNNSPKKNNQNNNYSKNNQNNNSPKKNNQNNNYSKKNNQNNNYPEKNNQNNNYPEKNNTTSVFNSQSKSKHPSSNNHCQQHTNNLYNYNHNHNHTPGYLWLHL